LVLKVTFEGPIEDKRVLAELLSPWHVSFTDANEADAVVAYQKEPHDAAKTLVIPCYSQLGQGQKWKQNANGTQIRVSVGKEQALTLTPKYVLGCPDPSATIQDPNVLGTDAIAECKSLINSCIDAKPAKTYSLLTRAPIPYSAAPKALKNLVMKTKNGRPLTASLCGFFQLDALRLLVAGALEQVSGKKLEPKTCKVKFLLTHDVDSLEGLTKAQALKRLEEKYDLPSAWYIPSKHYKLNPDAIKALADHGEVGAHDTKHDGKLLFTTQPQATRRLQEAKTAIETASGTQVSGFRAPLLQHNLRILQAVKTTGYRYDSSVPAWEPKHPATMKPHGLGTTFPFHVDGLVEVPVTLPQDHQMLTVSGMTRKEAVQFWFGLVDLIKALGGVCVLLVHPDYDFANLQNGSYEEILTRIVADANLEATLPSLVAADAAAEAPEPP
jgi:peptidoglycan/xylan/chitin deacetylase (PgdA/CDA1 family)